MAAKLVNRKKIRVLLVDDHPIVLEGIKTHLSLQSDLEVVGSATNGHEAIQKAKELQPDVILLDISMPEMNGLEAIALLRQQVSRAKILVLTMHNTREYIAQIIQTGARGYMLKDSSPSELIRAIELVYAGEVCFSPAVSRVLLDELTTGRSKSLPVALSTPLSDREREVLMLIADGHNNKEIASRLGIGVRTIETHRERIMRKLDIHSIAGLTKFAIAKGIVKLEQ